MGGYSVLHATIDIFCVLMQAIIQEVALFPTLVVKSQVWSKKECDLVQEYLQQQTETTSPHPSLTVDGVSSYSGTSNILQELEYHHPQLLNPIHETISYYQKHTGLVISKIENSWFNIQGKDSVLKKHIHGGAIVSGALYVHVDEHSSPLVLDNPNPFNQYMRKTHNTIYTNEWHSFTPRSGMLILFPGYLAHGSNDIANQTPHRTTISLNLN